MTLPNLGAFKGDVQVSAFVEFPTPVRIAPAGNVPYNGPLSVCDTAGWTEGGGDTNMYVSVDCRDVTGALTDSYFTMTFMQGLGLKGISGTGVAYGLADQPTTASYAAPSDYRFSAPAGTVHITRQGTGRYTVTFSAMPEGGAVLVSADTISARRCFVGSIDTAATPQKVTVRCIKFDGTPANSRFTIAYER